MIIDDESTGDTAKNRIFSNLAGSNIEYKKKTNDVKRTVPNNVYQFIHTKLALIVESDDELTLDAINIIIETEKIWQ